MQPGTRIGLGLLIAAVALTATAVALQRGGGEVTTTPSMPSEVYKPPMLDSFTLIDEVYRDGDGDDVAETLVRRYRNNLNESVFSMRSGDWLWAWSMSSHTDPDSPGLNYVIRDSNCDGVFDERYTLDEEFTVPECVKG